MTKRHAQPRYHHDPEIYRAACHWLFHRLPDKPLSPFIYEEIKDDFVKNPEGKWVYDRNKAADSFMEAVGKMKLSADIPPRGLELFMGALFRGMHQAEGEGFTATLGEFGMEVNPKIQSHVVIGQMNMHTPCVCFMNPSFFGDTLKNLELLEHAPRGAKSAAFKNALQDIEDIGYKLQFSAHHFHAGMRYDHWEIDAQEELAKSKAARHNHRHSN